MKTYQFSHAAVAGTFDRLHKGHKALLKKAFAIAKRVSVGITAKTMVQKKELKELIEPYVKRKNAIVAFLDNKYFLKRARIVPLRNIYGPAITDPTIEALVVSKKTLEGAKKVNRKRRQLKKPRLSIVVADYVESEDRSYLSSTRIRKGEIDRNGNSYRLFLLQHAPFILGKRARAILKKPLGLVLPNFEKAKPYIAKAPYAYAVGDVVTHAFLSHNIPVALAVFDFRNNRKQTFIAKQKRGVFYATKNDPGQISRGAIQKILAIQKDLLETESPRFNLLVRGEEDLLAVPIILCAQLSSLVFYGQPKQGIVMVQVTEKIKQNLTRLFANHTMS